MRNYLSKKITYISMVVLIFLWGFDYIAAKIAIETCDPVTIVFLKYSPAVIILFTIKIVRDRKFHLRKRDIGFLLSCALFGDVVYYAAEYSALNYLPVAIVTLVLAFVPGVSIITEIFLYKRLPTIPIVLGIIASAIGVGMIVGADAKDLLSGKLIGYVFIFIALLSWNIYNFMTARLTRSYDAIELSMYQLAGALIFCAPWGIAHLPAVSEISIEFIASIAYLSIISSFVGFIIYINAVAVIGVTPAALFSNMMPVTSAFLGWVILGETITLLQGTGGLVVIVAGAMVIYLKDKNPGRYFGKAARYVNDKNEELTKIRIDGDNDR